MWKTSKIDNAVLVIFVAIISNNFLQVFSQTVESLLGFDTNNPIIYQNSQFGNERSHFGWSVTLVESGLTKSAKSYWIFVGDPMGNSTDPTYSRVKEPGVVWRCSISASSSTRSDPECYIMNLDPIDGTCSGAHDYDFNRCRGVKPAFEYHNDNWVGGTLVSNQNRFVTCAHRWHRGEIPHDRPPSQQIPLVNGLCYWLNTNAMYSNWAQSRSNVNISSPNYGYHRLMPFFGQDPLLGQYWTGQNGLSNPDLAFAESGVSVHLSISPSGNNELLMGAPGARLFAGSVTRYTDGGFVNGVLTQGHNRLNALQSEFSKFSTVRLPETSNDYFNAYFGYAVTSGQYFNKGELWYTGGSPRTDKLLGQVILFQFPRGSSGWIVDFAEKVIRITNPVSQFGSYFGSVLASANVNGDTLGLDELFVGAPFQNTDSSDRSGGDQGAVFVFYKPIFNSINLVPILLTGSNYPGSRFGTAIASLGDINEDGYNDIAIGAPLEGPASEGAVYIFYGKENIGNDWKHGLRLSSRDYALPVPLKGFGCSFSNSIDIDYNGTPDLAIGSYISKSVAIFRTRPMLNIETFINFYESRTMKRISKVESSIKNFKVETCVTLYGNNIRGTLELEMSLKMDDRYRRFRFSSVRGTVNHRVNYKDKVEATKDKCTQFDVEVVTQEREIGDSAISPPITFEQFVEYKGVPVKRGPITIYQITGNGKVQAGSNSNPDQFCPACPFPASRSLTVDLPITSDCRDATRCTPDLKINAWFENTDQRQNVTKVNLDWSTKYTLWISVLNSGEPAFSPEVSVNFNSQLQQPPEFLFGALGCQFEGGMKDKFNCSLGKPIKYNEARLLGIPFTLNGIYSDQHKQIYNIHLNAGSRTDDPKSRAVFDLTLEVTSDSSVILIGSVSSEKNAVPVGSQFHQDYRVILQGRSPIAILNFKFKFPISSSDAPGTELLIAQPKDNVECRGTFSDFSKEEPEGDLPGTSEPNPNNDMGVEGNRRRRRQVDGSGGLLEFVHPERIMPNENMTVWECTQTGILCTEIFCVIHNFQPGEEIVSFQMKLIKKVIDTDDDDEELKKEKNLLLLESSGEVSLFGQSSGSQTGDSSKGFSQTVLRLDNRIFGEGTPLWYYIVSGIGGIILLALIMVCLYKAGFFKRSTKQQLQELKAQTEIQQSVQAASRRASAMSMRSGHGAEGYSSMASAENQVTESGMASK